MKVFEFHSNLGPDQRLPVPPEVAAQLAEGQQVRVMVLIDEPDEDAAWSRLALDRFLKGYADSDAIYDDLSTRS